MEDNFPISNIPLIFTQYRTRILEESGQQWFHSENNSDTVLNEDAVSVISASPPVIEEDLSSVEISHYEYPDPWGSSPPETGVTVPAVQPDPSETTEASPQEPPNPEPTSAQPSVNLFPFETATPDPASINGIYDLTEFDNGEIEVPPVAVRGAQPAKFEKVSRPSALQSTPPSSEDESLSLNDPNVLEAIDPSTLSSAELAKYRLRNCL